MKLIPLCALAAFCAVSAHAAVMDFGANFGTASHDTSIFQNATGNSDGGGPGLFAGNNGASSPRRSLISFDLSAIPSGATITDVQLTLTVGLIAGGGGSNMETMGLYPVSRAWGEGTVESGATTIGGTGNGATANTGDATWSSAALNTVSWTTAGGDHGAQSASLTQTFSVGSQAIWDSANTGNSQLLNDVQGWLSNSATNFGWEIIGNESQATTADGFYSREASGEITPLGSVTPSESPQLQVTFTAPEPGALSLLSGGAVLGLLRRGRPAPVV